MKYHLPRWVLVVAEDRRRRRFVSKELEDAGYAVATAISIDAALACLAVMRPALVVIDGEMPDSNRLETSVPVVKISGALVRP